MTVAESAAKNAKEISWRSLRLEWPWIFCGWAEWRLDEDFNVDPERVQLQSPGRKPRD